MTSQEMEVACHCRWTELDHVDVRTELGRSNTMFAASRYGYLYRSDDARRLMDEIARD